MNKNSETAIVFPKGATWLQEIVYLIMSDGDFQTATSLPCMARVPYIDLRVPLTKDCDPYDGMAIADLQSGPRILKSHLEYRFFERSFATTKPRVIVVMRNLKVSLQLFLMQ